MTREEAKQQIEAFFRRLGERRASFFTEKSHVEARLGESLLGFEYDEDEQILSAQALIYRFRSAPRDEVLDAVFAEETEANSGGGRLVFNSENSAFYLQRDFREKIGDNVFYEGVNRLAQASLRWHTEILAVAAEKAG
ncbi:MAG TPA: hypothetical protein VIL74_13975 [Pyrinomonadaceae bacterium]|jgi:hypothetical protein